MSSKTVVRESVFTNLAFTVQAVKRALEVEALNGIQQSCLSCIHFNEKEERCNYYGARPPARTIAFGCESYEDGDDIPF
jgi:hypothetical protein